MLKFTLKRLGYMLVVLFIVVTITFPKEEYGKVNK